MRWLHSWEFTYIPEKDRTKSWYHAKGFRQKLEEFGILTDERGCHVGLKKNGLFVYLLSKAWDQLCGDPKLRYRDD